MDVEYLGIYIYIFKRIKYIVLMFYLHLKIVTYSFKFVLFLLLKLNKKSNFIAYRSWIFG